MNINDLTIRQAKELAALFQKPSSEDKPFRFLGQKVIIRTYSAGVHFGELAEKDGKEVILKNARRLWFWRTANNGISLSEVAEAGLHKDSRVCASVDAIWLEAIEIMPCSKEAIKSIEAQDVYKA